MTELLDPGMQAERTWLAWARTGLTFAANGVLVIRSGLTEHSTPLLGVGVTMTLATAIFAVIGRRRHHVIVSAVRDNRNPMNYRLVRITTWTTIVTAVAVMAISIHYGNAPRTP
ncbi:MAG: DUF202 domain-containing protein [Actinobacteria bacterium]|nr:DUF202 domain-containing protein [Actinomycetota bacterium]MBI3686395.1 DUF202 domain-containing protein [Actinomycetota bacterium]